MLVVQVFVQVRSESLDAFIAATRTNAAASIQEPGIFRFDVVRQESDPTRFVLIEGYRTAEAPAAHKATAHYATWRETVEPMMASPRTSIRYEGVCFPELR